jgi:hypothetical protein
VRWRAFLPDHPVILAILLCVDVLGLVTTIPAPAAADTARQATLAVGRIVGATSSAARLLLVRQGRPRSALDAALAGIAVQVAQGAAVWILEADPRFLALAALAADVVLWPDESVEAPLDSPPSATWSDVEQRTRRSLSHRRVSLRLDFEGIADRLPVQVQQRLDDYNAQAAERVVVRCCAAQCDRYTKCVCRRT